MHYVSQVVRFLIPRIQIPHFDSLNIVRYDTICIWESGARGFFVGAMSESRGEAKENDRVCGNATHGRTKTQFRHNFEKTKW